MNFIDDNDAQTRHTQRMQRKKALIDAHIQAADQDKGLLLVLDRKSVV